MNRVLAIFLLFLIFSCKNEKLQVENVTEIVAKCLPNGILPSVPLGTKAVENADKCIVLDSSKIDSIVLEINSLIPQKGRGYKKPIDLRWSFSLRQGKELILVESDEEYIYTNQGVNRYEYKSQLRRLGCSCSLQ